VQRAQVSMSIVVAEPPAQESDRVARPQPQVLGAELRVQAVRVQLFDGNGGSARELMTTWKFGGALRIR